MSHFPVLVLTESGSEDELPALLAPYDENDEWFRDGSRWDWWMIGGRWTGYIDGGRYKPEEDPANVETCQLCAGTGRRPDAERFEAEHPGWIEWSGGCNGCNGTGEAVAWPTQWKPYAGDVRPVSDVEFGKYESGETFVPAALVTPDGEWHERARMGWFGCTIEDEEGDEGKQRELWEGAVRALLDQHPEAVAVLVDCHV